MIPQAGRGLAVPVCLGAPRAKSGLFFLHARRPLSAAAVRLNSTKSATSPEKPKQPLFDLHSLFVLSIPITSRYSYIYCNHSYSLLDANQRLPWLITAENKLISVASRAWTKLSSSNFAVNKKVVSWARKLLDTIPYNESCLKSFPSKTVMIREINGQLAQDQPAAMLTGQLEKQNVDLNQLKPIPVYHPRFQDALTIVSQMSRFREELGEYHRKRALWCALGIPISLPLALIPVLPNVPGFYFTYRLYCHVKALMGVRNMGYLLETKGVPEDEEPSPSDITHLSFEAKPELDNVFLKHAVIAEEDNIDNERVLLTPETIDQLVETTGLTQLAEELHKAHHQENARIQKQLLDNDVS